MFFPVHYVLCCSKANYINFTNGIPTCSAALAMILFSAACSRDLPFGLQQLVI